ncbi:MAG: CBASS cGAMP-activated phospholipase [Acidimicrobiales bacterium]
MTMRSNVTSPTEPVSRPFRILSLDGGGVKGAYTASVLATLEEDTGRRWVDHFDLIAGTSTGGIIAIGLGLGLTAREICDFYTERGDDIFPMAGVVGRNLRLARQLLRPKYDSSSLRAALTEILRDRPFGESSVRLVIPAYDVTEGRVFVFKTGHHERFRYDLDIPAVEIALATAAAPTYFGAATIEKFNASFVDGGVWANTPVVVALTEAVQFLGIPPSDIDILSVGTTTEPFKSSKRRNLGGVMQWGAGLIELLMTSQTQGVLAQAELVTNGGLFRINHLVQRGRFGLDNAETADQLAALGRSDAVKKDNLTAVTERFLNGVHAEAYTPVVSLDRSADDEAG